VNVGVVKLMATAIFQIYMLSVFIYDLLNDTAGSSVHVILSDRMIGE
jgi:hypothetical protein